MKVYREITPLHIDDTFVLIDSVDNGFDYPIHNHPEYELTLIMGSSGTRIVGDSTQPYFGQDLVLLGPYLHHKWDGDGKSVDSPAPCRVITMQFEINLFDAQLFKKKPFFEINGLLHRSQRGVRFTGRTFRAAQGILLEMTELSGMASVLKFLDLLDLLAQSQEQVLLASEGFNARAAIVESDRIKIAYQYILSNYTRQGLKIGEVSAQVNMADSAFSHFFKKCANKSFKQYLIDLRLGHACKLLIETDNSISEIGYHCFNNLTNFNRLFKKYRSCTPSEYRRLYKKKSTFDWTAQKTLYQFLPSSQVAGHNQKPKVYAVKLMHS